MPLHTLIELIPNPDGQMAEERIVIALDGHHSPPAMRHVDSYTSLPTVASAAVGALPVSKLEALKLAGAAVPEEAAAAQLEPPTAEQSLP